MNETLWLTTTDPAAMRRTLQERGLWTEERCRVFVEACRWEWCQRDRSTRYPADWMLQSDWIAGAAAWTGTGASFWAFRDDDPRPDIIRDVWGFPHRQREGTHWLWGQLHYWPKGCAPTVVDWLTWQDGTVPRLARACVEATCKVCEGRGGKECKPEGYNSHGKYSGMSPWPCRFCKCTGVTSHIGLIDPHKLAVLADGLEEAGCGDEGLLGHLRCNGPGTRPLRHWWTPAGGCWVLEMLLNGGAAAVGQPPPHR